MDFASSAVAATAQQAAPRYVADMRPVADAVALSRDPRPHVPMPMPAQSVSGGAPAAATADTRPDRVEAKKAPERVLKPYGITMLPSSDRQQKEKAEQAHAEQRPDRPAATETRSEDAAPREPSRAAPQSVTEAMTRPDEARQRAPEREDREPPKRERAELPKKEQEDAA